MFADASHAVTLSLTALIGAAGAGVAQQADAVAQAFGDHCFSPYLTAETAQAALSHSGARFDFYDLAPFSATAPSPVIGRALTPGTDRRCEVAFDGRAPQIAIDGIRTGLAQEGLNDPAEIPDDFALISGQVFAAAAQLNPNRIAVVQAGVRQGIDGPETFMNVERLNPRDEISQ